MIKVEKLNPFGRMCVTLGMLPSSYKESLTYEEQLLWFMDYLENTVIPAVNNNADATEELQTLFTELQSYVDNYFENLDVQTEINNKLDEMASDGTLTNLIKNYVDPLLVNLNNQVVQNSVNIGSLNEEIGNAVKTSDTNVITMSMLSQEVRESMTGESTAVVGDNSVNTQNISDGAVTIYKLDDLISENFTKEYSNISFGSPIQGNYKKIVDNVITNVEDNAYEYFDVSLDNNTIYIMSGYNMYYANAIIVYDPSDSNKIIYYTTIANPATNFEPIKLVFKTNKSGLKAYINIHQITNWVPAQLNLLPTLTKIKEITQNKKTNYVEKIKAIENSYLISYSASPAINAPIFESYTDNPAEISIYKLSKGTKYVVKGLNVYNKPGLTILNEKLEISYQSLSSNVGSTPVPYTYEFTASNDGYALLLQINIPNKLITNEIYIDEEENKYKSMKWTLIGDSLTDPNTNSSVKKYYSYIQDDLGIQIQNLGQGGCGYKRKSGDKNTFVEQSLLIDSDADVVTIFGSFNDHNIYDTDGLGNVTDTTTDTVFGCVNTTLQNIITNRPNAKIGVILPTPWNYTHANPYDPTDINLEYIEGIRTIAKKYSIPVLDLFYESNMYPWDSSFRSTYYVSGDGSHPNSIGNKRFAYQIEEFIKKLV